MTDLRTAAQQALEAMELAEVDPHSSDAIHKAIIALRAALAEPVLEPVAWMHTDPDNPRVKFLVWRENEPAYRGVWIKTPLYTSPPQRKPLTEEERNFCPRCGKRANGIHTCTPPAPLTDEVRRKPLTDEEISSLFRTVGSPVAFARAIERVHGIGDNT